MVYSIRLPLHSIAILELLNKMYYLTVLKLFESIFSVIFDLFDPSFSQNLKSDFPHVLNPSTENVEKYPTPELHSLLGMFVKS